MKQIEHDFRKDDAERSLDRFGGEPAILTGVETVASPETLEAVTLRGTIVDIVNDYCADAENGTRQVLGLLEDLPTDENINQNAYLAWETLIQTVEALRILTNNEEIERSAEDEDDTPKVDDVAIRKSAGYTNDEDVAQSSLQDTGKDVTDDDIGKSAAEGRTFQDQLGATPAMSYRMNTRRLFRGVLDHASLQKIKPLFNGIEEDDGESTKFVTHKEIIRLRYEIGQRFAKLDFRDDEVQGQDSSND
jgi:hypothetical protein